MHLNLIDQLTLLALDDKKGKFISGDIAFTYATAGALILELALEERVDLSDNHVRIINKELTGDSIIDTHFKTMIQSNKERKVKDWVERIGKNANQIKKETIARLVENKILLEKEEHFLWVFSYNQYPTQNPKPENQLRQRLYNIIVNNHHPELKEIMLLNLIESCSLGKEVFGKENVKVFKQKIKNRNMYESLAGSVNKSIKEINDAINAMLVIMMATTVTTH